MKNLYSTIFALGLCVLTTDSFSAVSFSDSFEGEGNKSTENYTPFEFWDVSAGSVDLISQAGDGGFGIPCFDGANCLDLDGTTNNSGILKTKDNFTLTAGTYELTFALSDNPLLQQTNSVTVSLGDVFTETITLSGSDPFMTFTREIVVAADTSGQLSFENSGGDNFGLILDKVALNSAITETPTNPRTNPVPLPPAAWLFLSGILGFSVFRKKST